MSLAVDTLSQRIEAAKNVVTRLRSTKVSFIESGAMLAALDGVREYIKALEDARREIVQAEQREHILSGSNAL